MWDNHSNFATGTLTNAPGTSGTSFVIQTGEGANFAANMPVTIVEDGVQPTSSNAEIGYITAVSTDTLTITRAQEGTSAQNAQAGWRVYGSITAKALTDIESEVGNKADTGHTHDDRYYTETETDTLLSGKAASSHSHTASQVTDFDTEVSNNTDVAANTSARHTHSNKAVLDAATASFTTADETKLDGIEAGAQVNEVTQAELDAHTTNTANPHSVTASQVGLGNVDNTSDADKPISTATQAALDEKVNKTTDFELIAHRGFAGLNVENTVLAFQRALTQGADSVEFDVQTSSSGTPYIFHDTTVDADTDGTGTFTALSDATIDGLEITLASGTALEGINIPTLQSAIDVLKWRSFMKLYPEIKGYNNQTTDITTMVNIIKDAGLSDRTMWQSFDMTDLEVVNAVDAEAEVGYLLSSAASQAALESTIDTLASTLDRPSLLANYAVWQTYPSAVDYARAAGVGVGTWTVPTKDIVYQMIDIGVYRIMTDTNIQGVK